MRVGVGRQEIAARKAHQALDGAGRLVLVDEVVLGTGGTLPDALKSSSPASLTTAPAGGASPPGPD